MKNLQRWSIFENDQPIEEQIKNSIMEIWDKPTRFFKMFRVLRIQICIALSLLITLILLPIRLIYG